ncbi:ATP-binding protein [Robiginitalea marina]|uniref:histidine kinase n=1 Tax=Robiginitalea marina TaxID=2954105 RepID=A0ABT1AY35_9FLAO|nr:ATP-binding protein [Robiginitalea marina]MCO5724936.1 response regulator [Robiginitalea marina]
MRKTPICRTPIQRYWLPFLCAFCLSSLPAQQQVGRPLITNYKYQEYDAAPINWWALEDDNGVMYFANQGGPLQFDGVNWRDIDTNGSSRSMAKDDKGTIYIGGNGEFGYLVPNAVGEMKFVSLVDKIPEGDRNFADVWEIDVYKGRVIFRTEFKLYCWDGETIKVIPSEQGYHVGAIVHGVYYLRIWNRGLCYLTDEDTFELVPGGERFAGERIYAMLPYDDKVLLGTRTQGFFLYDGKDFTPFKTELDEVIKGILYLPGVALDDGRYVFNTFGNGAYLMDKEGNYIQKYTSENGLQDGSATFAYVDSRGVLWMPLFNGISSVNLNSPFTAVDANMGLTTTVFATYKFKETLYFSTNNGVAYLEKDSKQVKIIPGTNGQVGNFFEFRNRLYACTNGVGMFEIVGNDIKMVRADVNYDFRARLINQSTTDPRRIIVEHQQGIKSFYFDEKVDQFVEESSTSKLISGSGELFETSEGVFWTNDGQEDGVMVKLVPEFIDGKLDLEASQYIKYGTGQGLPDAGIGFNTIDDELFIFSGEVEKTYGYNPEANRFEERKFFFDEYLDWDRPGTQPLETSDGKVFFGTGKGILVAEKVNGEYQVTNTETFKGIQNNRIFTIYAEEPREDGSRVIWFSGPDGAIRYEGNLETPTIPDFHTDIRSISIAGDSLVYSGNIALPEDLSFSFDNNSVNFGYAAPLFIGQKEIQYSTRLTGFDSKWSDWTTQTAREYINLPPGPYTFSVKARNIYGEVSEVVSVPFSISPPWYRTWWAYGLFALGALALLYFIVRARTRILVNQRKALEAKVEDRTREVQQRLNELATVNSVTKALNDKLELDELIQLVGNKMKEVFNSDITYLALLDRETSIINFPYQDGDDMPPMQLGEGLTSRIIQTGDSLLINRDVDIMAEYNKHGIQQTGKQAISYLGVPIPVEDSIIGVLSVQSTQHESRFKEEDKKLLSTIAINVGVALHNAELYEEAKVAKARAEEANEAKSAFLSTVSHELRTPLTSVLGFAKIIRKRLEDKIFPAVTVDDQKIKRTMKQVSENLDVVVSEGERLTTLINDVLDLAKIESGRMEWNMKPLFMQDVISRAVSATSSLFEQKKLALKKHITADLPLVSGDEDKLIQVVINLLSNAVKFTHKGTVTIDAYQDKNQLIVEVQDTGVGIAEEDKHKIFERFRQAGDTLTDKPQGTGLGLPICREIIEHHGGIIWMKSEPGVGSTFFFSIPVMGESGDKPIQLTRILSSLKKQIKHTSSRTSKERPTILVVDDDTPIRSLLRQELSEAGYQVKEAANGKAALDMVRIHKPDLIILDVMMPEINGFDVAAVLKNDPATMDIPIIILSIVQDRERGFRIGVDRYLTKPIDTEKLFHEVDELLEQGVSKKRVLVVDEDASAVKSLSEVLKARGYKVMEANPDTLFEMASEVKPDIIMLKALDRHDENTLKELKIQAGMENVMFFVYQ